MIPLYSALLDGEIATAVALRVPPLLLNHAQNYDVIPRVSLSWKMSPWLFPDEHPLPYPAKESRRIDERAHSFWNEFRLRPDRFRFAILAMGNDGKSVLLCRLVEKRILPIADDERSLIAFLSTIPVIPDSDCPEHPGYIWHSPQETLDGRSGTYSDHAVLLCSILLERGAAAWVVLAKNASTGLYACVLVKANDPSLPDAETCRLIDPVTGHVYKITDVHCPIHGIGTVFNSENIFYNLQEKGKPSEISWSFSDPLKWQPFFDRRFVDDHEPESIASQLVTVPVQEGTDEAVRQLTTDILLELFPDTEWRRELGFEMQTLLEQALQASISRSEDGFGNVKDDFKLKHRSEQFDGSPFCLISYVERDGQAGLQAQMEEEFQQRNVDPTSVIAQTVIVNPYPNGLFAIWVWILAVGSGRIPRTRSPHRPRREPIPTDVGIASDDELRPPPDASRSFSGRVSRTRTGPAVPSAVAPPQRPASASSKQSTEAPAGAAPSGGSRSGHANAEGAGSASPHPPPPLRPGGLSDSNERADAHRSAPAGSPKRISGSLSSQPEPRSLHGETPSNASQPRSMPGSTSTDSLKVPPPIRDAGPPAAPPRRKKAVVVSRPGRHSEEPRPGPSGGRAPTLPADQDSGSFETKPADAAGGTRKRAHSSMAESPSPDRPWPMERRVSHGSSEEQGPELASGESEETGNGSAPARRGAIARAGGGSASVTEEEEEPPPPRPAASASGGERSHASTGNEPEEEEEEEEEEAPPPRDGSGGPGPSAPAPAAPMVFLSTSFSLSSPPM
jgi:hypothetical protein